MISRISFIAAVSTLVSLLATCADAQQRNRDAHYRPSTPTVSPYLNLLRDDRNGGLPNYYSLVRPQQEQIQANRQAAANFRRQRRGLARLQNEVLRFSAPPTGTASGFFIQGQRNGFQQYSHFFPLPRRRR